MLVPVRGVLVTEGVQTGDGRFIYENVLTWAPLPLPIAYITGGDQHIDLLMSAPQIGTITAIARDGNDVTFAGTVDDEIPEGAELVRRMRAGSAANGPRQFVSIDPDDWAFDVVVKPEAMDEIAAEDDEDMRGRAVTASVAGSGALPALTAAAGDGAPEGEVLFSDSSDAMTMAFTRLRIRGVTACAVPAFEQAYMELDDAAPAEETPAEEPPAEAEGEGARVTVLASAPARPPRDWFFEPEPDIDDDRMVEQYDAEGNPIGFACPLTILDSGQWYGHLAAGWGQCHTGYQTCVNPPASPTSYAHFHVGEVVCDNGERVPTGNFVVGCDHAAANAMASDARDHYAHAGLAWGDGRVINGDHAPWGCGALRPGIDEATLRIIRATTLSGDWRRIGGALELIVALSVSGPGFPIGREALAASAVGMVAAGQPETFFANGVQTSLVATAGAARCKDCQERMGLQVGIGRMMDDPLAKMVERRTRHLIPEARDAMLAKIRGK